jgi:phosphotransacetylase
MVSKKFDVDELAKKFLLKCQTLPKIKVAVVYPCSKDALDGAIEAAQQGLIEPILIGPKTLIHKLATEIKIDIKNYEIIDIPDSVGAAEKSVELARGGMVDALMKGQFAY